MLAGAYGDHGGGCDCLHHITLKAAQIPAKGAVPFEALLGISALLDELWDRIEACDQCSGEPAAAHAAVQMADAIANLCYAACLAYALVPDAATKHGFDQIFTTTGPSADPSDPPLVCTRSTMRFGKYDFDDEEAALFARQVISRLLTDLSAFLRRLRTKAGLPTTASLNAEHDLSIGRALSHVLSLLGRLCSD
ncbi:hypothetical protein MPH_12496 [Macrophomina phaseolina MS6]|uniref:Uncharacterized protein n=1 Tax=Macrophomina phaseolina (strain MS6) TaxID=1126212 RepID=K2RBW8_MACPH|nr:hypothetical protein MPH_12496 [Macrophomina phaseolina MS6]